MQGFICGIDLVTNVDPKIKVKVGLSSDAPPYFLFG